MQRGYIYDKNPPVFALQHQRTVDFVDELMKILLIPTHAKGTASKPSPLTTAPTICHTIAVRSFLPQA